MEIIGRDKSFGVKLIGILGIDPKCKYCGSTITEESFGGLFSKPTRVCCDDMGCLSEAIYDTDEEKLDMENE